MISPRLYRQILLPPTAGVVRYFRDELEVPLVPYIIGGNTAPILDGILDTGTNNFLCDYKADLDGFVLRLAGEPVVLRANLDPRFLLSRPADEIKAEALRVLSSGLRHPRFMMGTGIIPFDMPPEKILAVREAIVEAG